MVESFSDFSQILNYPHISTQDVVNLHSMDEEINPFISSSSGEPPLHILASTTDDHPDPNLLQIVITGQSKQDPDNDGFLTMNEDKVGDDKPLKPVLSRMESMFKKVVSLKLNILLALTPSSNSDFKSSMISLSLYTTIHMCSPVVVTSALACCLPV